KNVNALDIAHPNYASPECVEARRVAMSYDDNIAGRAAVGLALGLFLGPFGIPLAAAGDAAQNGKREQINGEVQRHCAGIVRAQSLTVPSSPTLTGRLQELQELRMKGMLSEDEYQEQRRRILSQ